MCSYILATDKHEKVFSIKEGEQFGLFDIVAVIVADPVVDESNWYEHSHKIKRLGTVYSLEESSVLQFKFNHLDELQKKWADYSKELFQNGKKNFERYLNKSIEIY